MNTPFPVAALLEREAAKHDALQAASVRVGGKGEVRFTHSGLARLYRDIAEQVDPLCWDIFKAGLKEAAEICGSLAETTYDDSDGFAAATGCEAAIIGTLNGMIARETGLIR